MNTKVDNPPLAVVNNRTSVVFLLFFSLTFHTHPLYSVHFYARGVPGGKGEGGVLFRIEIKSG